jgi:hypothetical protein
MRKGLFANSSPVTKIFFSLFAAFATFFIIFFLATLLAIPIYKVDPMQVQSILSSPGSENSLSLLKYFQFAQTLGLFFLPSFIIAYFISHSPGDFLLTRGTPSFGIYLMVTVSMILALPLINFIAELNAQMDLPKFMDNIERWMRQKEDFAQDITEKFVKVDTPWGLIGNLLVMAVMPALGEEFLFRGVFQRIFVNWTKNVHWGIIISAALFSFFHFQFFGFIPRMLLGLFFGYLVVWSGSIWPAVAAHFVNNGFAVTVFYFVEGEQMGQDFEKVGATSDTYYMMVLSALIVGFAIYQLRKSMKKEPGGV